MIRSKSLVYFYWRAVFFRYLSLSLNQRFFLIHFFIKPRICWFILLLLPLSVLSKLLYKCRLLFIRKKSFVFRDLFSFKSKDFLLLKSVFNRVYYKVSKFKRVRLLSLFELLLNRVISFLAVRFDGLYRFILSCYYKACCNLYSLQVSRFSSLPINFDSAIREFLIIKKKNKTKTKTKKHSVSRFAYNNKLLLLFRYKKRKRRYRKFLFNFKFVRASLRDNILSKRLYRLNFYDRYKKSISRYFHKDGQIRRIYDLSYYKYGKRPLLRYYYFGSKIRGYTEKIEQIFVRFNFYRKQLQRKFLLFPFGDKLYISLYSKTRRRFVYFDVKLILRMWSTIQANKTINLKKKRRKYFLEYLRDVDPKLENVLHNRYKHLFKPRLVSTISNVFNNVKNYISKYTDLSKAFIKERVFWELKIKRFKDFFAHKMYTNYRKISQMPYVGITSFFDSFFRTRGLFKFKRLRKLFKGRLTGRYSKISSMRYLVFLHITKFGLRNKMRFFNYKPFIPFKYGMLHLKFAINNVFITLTGKTPSEVVFKLSSGICGYFAASKSTPYTRQLVVENAIKKAFELNYKVLDIKFLKRPRFWFFDSYLRYLADMKMCVRFLIYRPLRAHGYVRYRKRRSV